MDGNTNFENLRPSQNAQSIKLTASIVNEPDISDEEKIFFELNYLIEKIEIEMNPQECYFYDQLEVIRDRYKIVEKAKITQYFEKLVNVVQEDESESIRALYDDIKRIFDLLLKFTPDVTLSFIAAPKQKTNFENIDNIKPVRDASSSIGTISDEEALNESVKHQSEHNLNKQDSLIPGKYLAQIASQENIQVP